MANIRSFSSMKKEDKGSGRDGQEMYAGGAGQNGRGGSGMAVIDGSNSVDKVFSRAKSASSGGGAGSSEDATVTFYANGFTVDDGPLRTPDVKENKQFVDEVSKGYCPKELISASGKARNVNIIDKRGENYTAPKQKMKAFSGSGKSMSGGSMASPGRITPGEIDAVAELPTLDTSAPTTRIQIRSPFGRKVIKVNMR